MILNVSGRTDIVAFYMEWFIKRLQEGYVDVRNPYYPIQVSRINFEDVDLIVFCTKNPIPLLKYINDIKIPFILHVTITPYQKDIEPNLPPKSKIIQAVKQLATIIGKEKIYIRYDPIFKSNKYTINYHKKAFQRLTTLLENATTSIIISFIDYYKNVKNNINTLKLQPLTNSDYEQIGKSFQEIATTHHMTVQTCSEQIDLTKYGFLKKDCIDKTLAQTLTHKSKFKTWKSRNNKYCHCVEMVDIGAYNTCNHLCKYCYANFDEQSIETNIKKHDVTSSLLIGTLENSDIIKIRK